MACFVLTVNNVHFTTQTKYTSPTNNLYRKLYYDLLVEFHILF